MGSSQSQPSTEPPPFITVDRADVEAFKSVGVSDAVVSKVSNTRGAASGGNADELRSLEQELDRQKLENAKLRDQMKNLSALQHRYAHNLPRGNHGESLDEIEEKKRIFDETVKRVQNQYFSYSRENACASNEQEIVRCLAANPGKSLNCKPLQLPYSECIVKFRQDVLSAKS